jgi:hypothetical protein
MVILMSGSKILFSYLCIGLLSISAGVGAQLSLSSQNPCEEISNAQRNSGNRYCALFSPLGAACSMHPDCIQTIFSQSAIHFPDPDWNFFKNSGITCYETYLETSNQLQQALKKSLSFPTDFSLPWIDIFVQSYTQFYKDLIDIQKPIQDFCPIFGKGSWGTQTFSLMGKDLNFDIVYFPLTGQFGVSLGEIIRTSSSNTAENSVQFQKFISEIPDGSTFIQGSGGHATTFFKIKDQFFSYDCSHTAIQSISNIAPVAISAFSSFYLPEQSVGCLYFFPPI